MKYLRELLKKVLSGENASSILNGLAPNNKGHTGEALLRILVLHGIHPTNASSSVIPYKSIPITRRLEAISGISERLDILNTGLINAGGSNKIDVSWRDGNNIAVCSSKIGALQVKSIAHLEIGAMLTEFTESGGYTECGKPVMRESVVPYVLVDNKYDLLRRAERSKASNRVSKDNLNNVLDMDDLNMMCAVLLERIEMCPSKDFEGILKHLLSDEKPSLRTRLHQKLICSKVLRLIHSGNKTILIGALPRSGKTYMGAFIAKQYKKTLIITTRPSETRTQWNNVFKQHREFSEYKVNDLNTSSIDDIVAYNKMDVKMVAVSSIQFFKMNERKALIGLEWDLILLDEIHEGGSTELSNEMIDTYIGTKPVRIMMTATYTKPVEYYTIPSECCCFWDLEDVRLMRSWGEPSVFARLCEKYGRADVVIARDNTYKSGETDASIRDCYVNAPKLGILTNIMQSDIYEELRMATNSPDNVYGFSMRSLFMPTKDGNAFQNQKAVDTFLAMITGSLKMKHFPNGDMSMFARIARYWKTIGHRDNDEFMTQLWFLPSGVGQHLIDVKPAIISRINANPILKEFATLTLDSGMGDISKAVACAVVDAKAQEKKGIIILTGNVGSLGVSLPEVDIAFMLHDIESADMNFQQLMRVLTDMLNKKCGLVVDFNVWRVLNTLNTYATSRCGQAEKSSADRITWCISNLVDIDPDMWECKESPETFTQEKIAEELTKQWRKLLEQTGTSLNQLARKPLDLGEDQNELDKIAKYMDDCSSKARYEVNPDQEKLCSGVKVMSSDDNDKKEDDDDNDKKEDDNDDEKKDYDDIAKKTNINDVLARLIPEIAMLSGCKPDLLEAMHTVNNEPRHREALDEFLIHLYGMKQLQSPLNVLLKLVQNNYKKLNDAREIFEVISNRMGTLDNPEELVAFIGQHLKPKELEKKLNGEVFTPPSLIQEKFDKLTIADPSIWCDPSKKFLDPANGIGNYPALAYHRLMEGLKKAIPDEASRKKHIIENMLYMCELNKKNVEVSRKVFDPEGVYAMKLYQGSYLDLDPKKEWGVETFDVVFGNPPYQMQVGPRKTQPLWNLFVLKSINLLNKNGYVVFVHPSGWRSPDGVFKAVYDKIMERDLVYINMNNFKKGQEVFNVGTNFDYYILKNSTMKTTIINDIDDKEYTLDLKGWSFLPSGGFELYEKLLSLNGEEKVEVIHDYSLYETRKSWMSRTKTEAFKYPCCYTITGKDGMKCFYSSEKKVEHFGIPKVIWSNGLGTYPVIDDTGTYGLTQFSYAIVDTLQNLEKIKDAMNNPKFIQLMEYVKFTNNKYNYKVIRLMKKDFWKVFVDQAENESSQSPLPALVVAPVVAQPVAVATTTQPDYKKMKVADLKQLCKDRMIKGIAGKKKEALIAMLST